MSAYPYKLGFAVKVLGEGGLQSADTRRWQSAPHLRRSLELLDGVFDYLDRKRIRMFRLSSSTIPYGTHPHLPQLDYRRQIEECAGELALLAAKAQRYRLRLSTHPGQYAVLNAPSPDIVRKSSLDVEQDACLLDVLGAGPEGAVVVHVGGTYGAKAAALERWARAYEALSERARERLAVEHDETSFTLEDVLWLHDRVGVRVVYDHHHHRCNPSEATLQDAYATWAATVRPKVHVSSPRTAFRTLGRGSTVRTVPPLAQQHADFVTPWDVAEVLHAAPGPLDVMLEAKAKDVALLWLRDALSRRFPDLARAEEQNLDRSLTAIATG